MVATFSEPLPDYTGARSVATCLTCTSEIPLDSTFCPMCGQKRDLDLGADTEPPAVSPVPTPQPMTSPSPAGSAPGTPVPNPAAGVVKRKTIPLTAAAAEALAAQFDAGPQKQSGAPRESAVGVYRVPGTPARIPMQPRPARIVFGVVLIAVGLWSALGVLPGREGTLDDALYIAGIGGSIALVVFGLFATLAGAFYRAQVETICRKCDVQVIGWKRPFGLHCPMGGHYARLNWFLVVVTTVFWLAVLVIGSGLTYLLLS